MLKKLKTKMINLIKKIIKFKNKLKNKIIFFRFFNYKAFDYGRDLEPVLTTNILRFYFWYTTKFGIDITNSRPISYKNLYFFKKPVNVEPNHPTDGLQSGINHFFDYILLLVKSNKTSTMYGYLLVAPFCPILWAPYGAVVSILDESKSSFFGLFAILKYFWVICLSFPLSLIVGNIILDPQGFISQFPLKSNLIGLGNSDSLEPLEAFCDSAEANQLGFQDPATPVMEGIINLHDHIFFFLIVISIGVLWMIGVILKLFANNNTVFSHKYLIHGTLIEIIWTITPALILVSIAFPSFKLLYLMDEVIDPGLTFKAIGHQWYWSYEFSDYVNDNFETINFDSYMVPTDDLIKGDLRLLEVDNRIILPIHTPIRVIITAADVLHAWAIPSLGIKLDAVPGRLNQTSMYIKREGLYYGQCSELCGVQHGFMPIVIRGVSVHKFFSNLLDCIENYKK